MGFQAFYIEEPLLTFGENQQHVDPKMGLMAYGPCLTPRRKPISSSIRIGIIGSGETIDLTQQWIKKCQSEIIGKSENPNLFQTFPGFTRVFGCELRVLKECIEVLTEAEIQKVIKIKNFRLKVEKAASLFIEKLRNLQVREPRPHVVICALPQKIVDECGTGKRGKLTRQEKNILKIIRKHRMVGQTTLVPFDESVLDIISEASDLRCIIKAKVMEIGIPTQLAKPKTFISDPTDDTLQDEATRAWNFSVALYYKAEGYPWKLTEMVPGTCYVGVTFYKDLTDPEGKMRTSMAQVFTHTGEGLVLRGGRALFDETKSPHMSKKGAYQLMKDVLQLYYEQMGNLPARLVVHKSSRFWPGEISGFNEAAKDIKLKDYVTIQSRGIRFMREKGKYPPLRGTVIKIGKKNYILFTKGWIPYYQTYPGLRVPVPLEIVEHYGDSSIETICKEILALTKLNWNSADFCISEPVTLAYSRQVGKILAYIPEEVKPRPEYRFYM
ncbi:MAG: hypothetical protein QXX41_04275 [Nitrososphaerota archaeon]